MTKYELIGENNVDDLFNTLLENRNIKGEKAIELFLNPSKESLISPFKLKNMEEAIFLLLKHIKAKNEIVVVVDSDMDGYTSATIMVDFLQRVLKSDKVVWFIHEGKGHGLSKDIMEKIGSTEAKLVILPDASSNDWYQHKELSEKGVDVLVLDHHEIEINSQAIADGLCSSEGESNYAMIVNPLLSPEYDNKQISGVGVTYKYVEAFCNYLELDNYHLDYLDLVAMGNVADMMDLRSPETRYLVYEGLKQENLTNPLLKSMVSDYSGSNAYMTPERISWDIAPKVNGMIRTGKEEEKVQMMEALLGIDYEVTRTWRKKTYVENLPQCVTRLAKNAHARGKKLKTKIAKEAIEKAEELGILDKNILIIPMDSIPSGMSGIVAQEVSSLLKKPVSIVSDDKQGNYAGSVRGYDPVHTDTKSLFENSGLVNFARGHGQAHGVSFSQELHLELVDKISEVLDNEENGLPVDFILSSKFINSEMVNKVSSLAEHFGRGFEKPKFVFENVEITPSMCSFTENSMTIEFNGIQIIAFKKDLEFEKLINEENKVTIDIVGALGLGQWRGRPRNQLQVDSLFIKEHVPHKVATIKKGFGFVAF